MNLGGVGASLVNQQKTSLRLTCVWSTDWYEGVSPTNLWRSRSARRRSTGRGPEEEMVGVTGEVQRGFRGVGGWP